MIVGFDCSSKAIHAVVLSSKGKFVSKHKWSDASKDTNTRFVHMIAALKQDENFDIHDVELVVIENAIYVQNPITTMSINKVIGGVQFFFFEYEIPVLFVENKTWKKEVIGNGNVDKEGITKFVVS